MKKNGILPWIQEMASCTLMQSYLNTCTMDNIHSILSFSICVHLNDANSRNYQGRVNLELDKYRLVLHRKLCVKPKSTSCYTVHFMCTNIVYKPSFSKKKKKISVYLSDHSVSKKLVLLARRHSYLKRDQKLYHSLIILLFPPGTMQERLKICYKEVNMRSNQW